MNIIAIQYGSMATGFAWEESDIDLALFGVDLPDQIIFQNQIKVLVKKFENDSIIKNCKYIPTATVPLIKLVILFRKIDY